MTESDLLIGIINREGFASESDKGLTAILDTELTPELITEGLARELISKIQTMRKDSGFEVTDRIVVYYHTESPEIKAVFDANMIAKEVLADKVVSENRGKEWSINGLSVKLDVQRV